MTNQLVAEVVINVTDLAPQIEQTKQLEQNLQQLEQHNNKPVVPPPPDPGGWVSWRAEIQAGNDALAALGLQSGVSNQALTALGVAELAGEASMLALSGAAVAATGFILEQGAALQNGQAQLEAWGNVGKTQANEITQAFLSQAGSITESAGAELDALASVTPKLELQSGAALNTTDALREMSAATDLSEASGQSLATSTAALAQTQLIYGQSSADAARDAGLLTAATELTGTSVDNLTQTIGRLHDRLGPVAPDLQGTVVLLTQFEEAGVTGSRGLLAISSGLDHLLSGTKPVTDAERELGIAVTDANGKYLSATQIIGEVANAIHGMTDAQALHYVQLLMGTTQGAAWFDVLRNYNTELPKAQQAVNNLSDAHQQAEQRTATFSGELGKAKAAVQDWAGGIGDVLVGNISKATSSVGDMTTNINGMSVVVSRNSIETVGWANALAEAEANLRPTAQWVDEATKSGGNLANTYHDDATATNDLTDATRDLNAAYQDGIGAADGFATNVKKVLDAEIAALPPTIGAVDAITGQAANTNMLAGLLGSFSEILGQNTIKQVENSAAKRADTEAARAAAAAARDAVDANTADARATADGISGKTNAAAAETALAAAYRSGDPAKIDAAKNALIVAQAYDSVAKAAPQAADAEARAAEQATAVQKQAASDYAASVRTLTEDIPASWRTMLSSQESDVQNAYSTLAALDQSYASGKSGLTQAAYNQQHSDDQAALNDAKSTYQQMTAAAQEESQSRQEAEKAADEFAKAARAADLSDIIAKNQQALQSTLNTISQSEAAMRSEANTSEAVAQIQASAYVAMAGSVVTAVTSINEVTATQQQKQLNDLQNQSAAITANAERQKDAIEANLVLQVAAVKKAEADKISAVEDSEKQQLAVLSGQLLEQQKIVQEAKSHELQAQAQIDANKAKIDADLAQLQIQAIGAVLTASNTATPQLVQNEDDVATHALNIGTALAGDGSVNTISQAPGGGTSVTGGYQSAIAGAVQFQQAATTAQSTATTAIGGTNAALVTEITNLGQANVQLQASVGYWQNVGQNAQDAGTKITGTMNDLKTSAGDTISGITQDANAATAKLQASGQALISAIGASAQGTAQSIQNRASAISAQGSGVGGSSIGGSGGSGSLLGIFSNLAGGVSSGAASSGGSAGSNGQMSGISDFSYSIPNGSQIATQMEQQIFGANLDQLTLVNGTTIEAFAQGFGGGPVPVSQLIGGMWQPVSNPMGMNIGGFYANQAPPGSIYNNWTNSSGSNSLFSGSGGQIGNPGTSFGNAYWGSSASTPMYVQVVNQLTPATVGSIASSQQYLSQLGYNGQVSLGY